MNSFDVVWSELSNEVKERCELYNKAWCIDKDVAKKVTINKDLLIREVIDSQINPSMLKTLVDICNNIIAWNFAIISKDEIVSRGYTTRSHYSRWVREVSKYVSIQTLFKTGKILILKIHPELAWKGNNSLRKVAAKKFYNCEAFISFESEMEPFRMSDSRFKWTPNGHKDHYVYCVYVDNKPVYVGKGRGGRCKHSLYGSSHVQELNRDFIEGRDIRVVLLCEGLANQEALHLEAVFINKISMVGWNIYNKSIPKLDKGISLQDFNLNTGREVS